MHTYFVAYEVDSVGTVFQKLHRRSTVVTISKPVSAKEDLALIRNELVVEIEHELRFACEAQDIWIASCQHLHSRP